MFQYLPIHKMLVIIQIYFVFQRKDASIVDLTNQLHEIELNQVQAKAVVDAAVLSTSSPPINDTNTSTGETKPETKAAQNSDLSNKEDPSTVAGDEEEKVPLSLKTIVSACTAAKRFQTVNNSVGMSFDQERKIFREFVEVGTQTKSGHQSGQEIIPSR